MVVPGADLLRELFKAHARDDADEFRAAALRLVSEERKKNHRLLADDLERILMNGRLSKASIFPRRDVVAPKDRERGADLVEISDSELDWDRIVLPSETLELLQEIALDHLRADVLAASGLLPRNRLLFYGPPGCGKTLAAQVMAGVLSRPLVTVRFDAVVSSLLGETAANLRAVFDFISTGDWVVLFDEFDALGKDRDNTFEHGELKRVVNSLLQLMDSFRGNSLLIAATNHEQLLDSAIWRRFDMIVPFVLPKPQDRILLLRQYLRAFNTSSLSLEALSRQLSGASGADVERVAQDAARHAVLDGRREIVKADVESPIRDFKRRLSVGRPTTDPARSPKS